MPAIDRIQPIFEARIEQVGKKIEEIKSRSAGGMDEAMDVVEQNLGRQEAREAEMSLQGLGDELSAQEAAMHRLDPAKVADLISDPFED